MDVLIVILLIVYFGFIRPNRKKEKQQAKAQKEIDLNVSSYIPKKPSETQDAPQDIPQPEPIAAEARPEPEPIRPEVHPIHPEVHPIRPEVHPTRGEESFRQDPEADRMQMHFLNYLNREAESGSLGDYEMEGESREEHAEHMYRSARERRQVIEEREKAESLRTMKRGDLRRAVIVSEILDKPKSLKMRRRY